MYLELFQQLGLAKNEARIYETLLKEGESSVGTISTESGVYRRNVYDSLNRLVEKGLVFEIIERNERHYQAVEPKKLAELIEEKQTALNDVMPELEKLYKNTPHKEEVFIYKGVDGVKNYMRDIIRTGENVYVIGGKAGWFDKRILPFTKKILKDANKKGIKFYPLLEQEIKKKNPEVLDVAKKTHRFIPEDYSAPGVIDIFGDRVVITTNTPGKFEEDITLTVIVNQQIADSFRIWHKMIWDLAGEEK